MRGIFINNVAVMIGGDVRYNGELYKLANFGPWGVRIERGDCVLFIQPDDLELP